MVISGYLWITKASNLPLVCVGDCDTVNASEWSMLLGSPVAAWGFVTYLGLGGLAYWLSRKPRESFPALAGFGLAVAGALYSLYLTSIEALVLRAYCIWCLVSWIIITAIAVIWARGVWSIARPDTVGAKGRAGRKQRRRA